MGESALHDSAEPSSELSSEPLDRLLLGVVGIALVPFAALVAGAAPFVAALIVPATALVLLAPTFLIALPLVISPLLGNTQDSSLGGLNAMSILALWFLALGALSCIPSVRTILRERLFMVLLMLLGVTALSVLVSSAKTLSSEEVVRQASSLVMLFVSYLYAKSGAARRRVVAIVLLAAAVPLLVGTYQAVSGDVDFGQRATVFELKSDLLRIYSTFWDVHPYAKYLLAVTPLVLGLLLYENRRPGVWLATAILFVVLVLNLIFTYARSEIVGLLIAGAASLYAFGKLRLRVILLGLPVLAAIALVTGVVDRFADVFQPIDLESTSRENSLESRILIWMQGLRLAIQHPWLGHGAGTFEPDIGIEAHSVYIGLFYELGVFGPILYLAFIVIATRLTWACSRAAGVSRFDRCIAAAMFGTTVAIGIVSAAENYAEATTMWWPYFALLGCVLSSIRRLQWQRE